MEIRNGNSNAIFNVETCITLKRRKRHSCSLSFMIGSSPPHCTPFTGVRSFVFVFRYPKTLKISTRELRLPNSTHSSSTATYRSPSLPSSLSPQKPNFELGDNEWTQRRDNKFGGGRGIRGAGGGVSSSSVVLPPLPSPTLFPFLLFLPPFLRFMALLPL